MDESRVRPVRPEDVAAAESRGMRLPFDGWSPPSAPPVTWSARSGVFSSDDAAVDPVDSFVDEAIANALRVWARDPEGRFWAPAGWRVWVVEAAEPGARQVVAAMERPRPLWRTMPDYLAFRAEVDRVRARWAEHPEEAPGAPGPS